jgi:hypothetical protein
VEDSTQATKDKALQNPVALQEGDKRKCVRFCTDFQAWLDEDGNFLSRVVFSDETTSHLSGHVNHHKVRIWGAENPNTFVEHVRDNPKINEFCVMSALKIYGHFFFAEQTVTGITYLDTL